MRKIRFFVAELKERGVIPVERIPIGWEPHDTPVMPGQANMWRCVYIGNDSRVVSALKDHEQLSSIGMVERHEEIAPYIPVFSVDEGNVPDQQTPYEDPQIGQMIYARNKTSRQNNLFYFGEIVDIVDMELSD